MVRTIQISGEKFAELWRESVLSQEAFAQAVGMKRNNLFRLTRPGVHGVFRDRFNRIAIYLKLTPEELVRRIGTEKKPAAPVEQPLSTSDDVVQLLQNLQNLARTHRKIALADALKLVMKTGAQAEAQALEGQHRAAAEKNPGQRQLERVKNRKKRGSQ